MLLLSQVCKRRGFGSGSGGGSTLIIFLQLNGKILQFCALTSQECKRMRGGKSSVYISPTVPCFISPESYIPKISIPKTRAAENRTRWKGIVANSSVVP